MQASQLFRYESLSTKGLRRFDSSSELKRYGTTLRNLPYHLTNKTGTFVQFLEVTDGLSKENCIAAHLFAKQVRQLYRKSGPLSTALYLKQCGVCLQQVYAGPPYEHERLPVFVSLSRNGLPRIIPSFHRKESAGGSAKRYATSPIAYLRSMNEVCSFENRLDSNVTLSSCFTTGERNEKKLVKQSPPMAYPSYSSIPVKEVILSNRPNPWGEGYVIGL
ncbi:hypothetical protein KIW84_MT0035 (mitochondrion) [Lathyrus oleraceus]|nr:hypothetical protein KIW84_MT0035 [Pisum sativum]